MELMSDLSDICFQCNLRHCVMSEGGSKGAIPHIAAVYFNLLVEPGNRLHT